MCQLNICYFSDVIRPLPVRQSERAVVCLCPFSYIIMHNIFVLCSWGAVPWFYSLILWLPKSLGRVTHHQSYNLRCKINGQRCSCHKYTNRKCWRWLSTRDNAGLRAHKERISNMGWGPYATLVSDKQKWFGKIDRANCCTIDCCVCFVPRLANAAYARIFFSYL